jgi:integrase
MNMLVSLMGHASKKMVYEVYGDWKAGMENERAEIQQFFGEDFLK